MILFDERESTGAVPITLDSEDVLPARIKVIGVGGGGGNAVNRMMERKLGGIEFITANTDVQALRKGRAPVKLQLGPQLTRGLGAGGDPEVGRKSALEDTERVLSLLDGADMVFLTAGLGGGTGTGALPVFASLATEVEALTVAVVTLPFGFEGKRRMELAKQGMETLAKAVDTLIAIPNERLLQFVERGTSLGEAFRVADDVLGQAVQGISDLITVPGEINVDFADVKTIMTDMGMALMGTGVAKGESRAVEAAQRAISSPLLEETSIEGARGVLLNISGGRDLTLHEVAEAARIVAERVDPDANIISGMVIDESLEDEMKVTVIATGFGLLDGQGKSEWTDLFPEAERAAAGAEGRVATRGAMVRRRSEPAAEPPEEGEEGQPRIPFFRRVVAQSQGDDPGGFGPNWSNVDDYDIPTVLRKQMD